MSQVAPAVSIVVPVFNEVPTPGEDSFKRRIQNLLGLIRPQDEIILVDGGSADYSWPALQALSNHPQVSAIQSGKGRALQMNTGAAYARGELLLFLHADTVLNETAWRDFLAKVGGNCWGRFDVQIEGRSKWLPVVAWFMNRRSALSKIGTGDQALFVDRELFEQVGGFPLQPLMEDIQLCKNLKRIAPGQFLALHSKVLTSGRRWDQNGAWKTILLMWRFRYQYWRGVSAQELARQYADTREKLKMTVAVFAKYPEAGRVKTRLQPLLGAEGCAAFARYLLLSTLNKLQDVNTVLWTDGGTDAEWQTLLSGQGIQGQVQRQIQPEGHLGIRMQAAVKEHLKTSEVVVLLGPDAVQFTKADLDFLQNAALEKGIAFIPALDGGYVALACTRCVPEIFSENIHWGTSTVAEQTRLVLQQQGLQSAWLPAQMDVDEPEDFRHAVEKGFMPADWIEHYAAGKV